MLRQPLCIKIPAQFADESFKLFSKIQAADPTPDEAKAIRNKCLWRIIPLLCIGYHLMYVDKQTLGSSAILGIMDDARLNSSQYNWLSTIFYFGYLPAEWPQTWALQRFPVGKWGCIILLHAPCNNFASLFVVRFLLGLAEACIGPTFLVVIMLIMWSIGDASPITSGLLSYGWFMMITGIITIIFGVVVWLFFPDSPIHASFLTYEERAQAILRIKENYSGIEQKTFKKYQFIEAIKNPKTWLLFLHAWLQEMANGMTNQYSLIINSFAFTVLQTTLLDTVSGIVSFVSLGTVAIVLYHTKNCRTWVSLVAYIQAILNWVRSTAGIPYAVVMVWAANASAGHTKKTTVIALYHVGYGLGNIISSQLFWPQWKPRYRPTWWNILVIAAIVPMIIIIVLRVYLVRENKRCDKLQAADQVVSNGVVEIFDSDGTQVARVGDNSQMDLTDRENLTL
ncbi:hypothetical protein BDW71DRAFT_200163 [Aspergillus fruticulosus]